MSLTEVHSSVGMDTGMFSRLSVGLPRANLAIGLNHSAPVTVEQCVCACVSKK